MSISLIKKLRLLKDGVTVLEPEFNTRFKGLQIYALTTIISTLLLHLKEKS